jgi:hypothetical protein
MLATLKFIAILAASVFAAAALYVNVVEHPARMTLDTKSAAIEWAPSYARATWMQAPLALLSLVTGLASWLLGAGVGWAVAALLVGAVVPFTFLGIMPTNRAILATGRDLASLETHALLVRWAKERTVVALGARCASLWSWPQCAATRASWRLNGSSSCGNLGRTVHDRSECIEASLP